MKTTPRLAAWGLGLVIPIAPALAQGAADRWMWGSGWGWGWGAMMFGGGLMMLVFLGGMILLVVLLARGLGGRGSSREPTGPSGQTALEILQERYARGEIDHQEYDERRKTLGG